MLDLRRLGSGTSSDRPGREGGTAAQLPRLLVMWHAPTARPRREPLDQALTRREEPCCPLVCPLSTKPGGSGLADSPADAARSRLGAGRWGQHRYKELGRGALAQYGERCGTVGPSRRSV